MFNKPTEQFGGILIILSGVFNQNRATSCDFIFEKDESGSQALTGYNARKEMNDTRFLEPHSKQFAYDKVLGTKDEKDAKFKTY